MVEVAIDSGASRKAKAPINLMKEYRLGCGLPLGHNEAFERALQRLGDQGIVQFRQYPEEKYKATLKGKILFPRIQETFVNKVTEHGRHVEMISNKVNIEKATDFILECAPGEELKRWTFVEIPEIFFFS